VTDKTQNFYVDWQGGPVPPAYHIHSLAGESTESYNDIDHKGAVPEAPRRTAYKANEAIRLPPHSVNIIRFEPGL
jgi:hypothetical protein